MKFKLNQLTLTMATIIGASALTLNAFATTEVGDEGAVKPVATAPATPASENTLDSNGTPSSEEGKLEEEGENPKAVTKPAIKPSKSQLEGVKKLIKKVEYLTKAKDASNESGTAAGAELETLLLKIQSNPDVNSLYEYYKSLTDEQKQAYEEENTTVKGGEFKTALEINGKSVAGQNLYDLRSKKVVLDQAKAKQQAAQEALQAQIKSSVELFKEVASLFSDDSGVKYTTVTNHEEFKTSVTNLESKVEDLEFSNILSEAGGNDSALTETTELFKTVVSAETQGDDPNAGSVEDPAPTDEPSPKTEPEADKDKVDGGDAEKVPADDPSANEGEKDTSKDSVTEGGDVESGKEVAGGEDGTPPAPQTAPAVTEPSGAPAPSSDQGSPSTANQGGDGTAGTPPAAEEAPKSTGGAEELPSAEKQVEDKKASEGDSVTEPKAGTEPESGPASGSAVTEESEKRGEETVEEEEGSKSKDPSSESKPESESKEPGEAEEEEEEEVEEEELTSTDLSKVSLAGVSNETVLAAEETSTETTKVATVTSALEVVEKLLTENAENSAAVKTLTTLKEKLTSLKAALEAASSTVSTANQEAETAKAALVAYAKEIGIAATDTEATADTILTEITNALGGEASSTSLLAALVAQQQTEALFNQLAAEQVLFAKVASAELLNQRNTLRNVRGEVQGFFASFFYDNNTKNKLETSYPALTLGADYQITPDFKVGGFLTYSSAKFSVPNLEDYKDSSVGVSGFVDYAYHNYFVTLLAGYSHHSFGVASEVDADESYSSYSLALRGGYDFDLAAKGKVSLAGLYQYHHSGYAKLATHVFGVEGDYVYQVNNVDFSAGLGVYYQVHNKVLVKPTSYTQVVSSNLYDFSNLYKKSGVGVELSVGAKTKLDDASSFGVKASYFRDPVGGRSVNLNFDYRFKF